MTIVDISCGGIAVIDSGEPDQLETDMCLRGCRVRLPELGELTADILVKSTALAQMVALLRNG